MWDLSLCLYNVMLTIQAPFRENGQTERAERIPDALMNSAAVPYDVLVFTELIAPDARRLLLDRLHALGWSFVSDVLQAPVFCEITPKAVSSGVIIASRHPILTQSSFMYTKACLAADCWAAKGVVYCRISKHDQVCNIFATHLQAWDTPQAQQVRLTQARQCRAFMDSLRIPHDEPVLFVGDLNFDLYTRHTLLSQMASELRVRLLPRCDSSSKFTIDPGNNSLVGNDIDSMYATKEFPSGCYAEYLDTLVCACCPKEWLDYVAVATDHLQPQEGACVSVLPLRAPEPFAMKFNLTHTRLTSDLSDHFPIVVNLSFARDCLFSSRDIGLAPQPFAMHPLWCMVFVVVALLLLASVLLTVRFVSRHITADKA